MLCTRVLPVGDGHQVSALHSVDAFRWVGGVGVSETIMIVHRDLAARGIVLCALLVFELRH